MGKVIFWLAAIVAAGLAMQSAVHSQADAAAKEDWSKEFAGGIVPAERMGGDNPNHLMTSEHMLNPYFEPVASGVLEFRFSKKGLLGVLRSQRIGETIKPGECPVEHDLIELLVYDPKRHKSYVVFRKQVSHSERGRKRLVGDWGFHRNG